MIQAVDTGKSGLKGDYHIHTYYSDGVGATLPKRDYEHMEASIEYIKEGGYYLIRYEKGFIRAWGAIKAVW